MRIKYIPGPNKTWDWGECFVEEGDPRHYYHLGIKTLFQRDMPLDKLLERGHWERAIDPELEMDVGL